MLVISIFPCVYLLVLLVGCRVLDFLVNKLNTVQHELLHLWKTFLNVEFLGGKSTVSDICSSLVLWIYYLWHLYLSMTGSMYQKASTCSEHDSLSFGIWRITNLFPGVVIAVRL